MKYPCRPRTGQTTLLALAISLSAAQSSFVNALTFELADGDIQGRLNTTLSIGTSYSTAAPDKDLLPTAYGGRAGGINSNDGRQNFDRGDAISRIFKGSTELSLNYENYGAFVSAKYWYDDVLENGKGRFKDFDDSGFDSLAKFSGVALMDAYVWGEFEVADRPLDIRFGRQVLSWGESTFIQGGINVINPIDANAITRPGVELKEALLPVNMISASFGLTENLSAEAFYQLEWQSTVLPGCGTFFSQSDAIPPGCGPLYAVSGLTEEQQEDMSLVNPALPDTANMVLQRRADDTPSDSGQWGIALRYFAEWLNDTEFGLYVINYHSRLPYVGAITADYDDRPGNGFFLNGVTNNLAYCPPPGAPCSPFAQGPEYLAAFPKDIRLYGLSFNTSGPFGMSLSGEISHRPDMPIAINGQDFLYATGFLDTESPIVDEIFDIALPSAGSGPIVARNEGLYGMRVDSYRKKPVTQMQVTMIQTFSDILGSDRLSVVAEVGAIHVGDLEDESEIKYGRSALYGSGEEGVAIACQNDDMNAEYCTLDGFTTDWSWGYRVKSQLMYSNVFKGINITPGVAFKHDVNGYSYAPGSQFVEGRKAVTLSVNLDYLGTYNAGLSYTDFFGGEFNTQTDRDFLSMTVGMKF